MVISTGSIAKLLWPGLNARWGVDYAEHPVEWTDLVDKETSSMNYEEEQEMIGFGLAPAKPQGQPTVYDTAQQGITTRYTHIAYSLGFIITHEALVDNLYEKVGMQRTGSLAFSARQTKENVVANIYNRAFNSSYLGADGKTLLATDHPGYGTTFANKLGTDADLSEAAIEDMVTLVMNATNSRGLKIALMPKKLIVATANWAEAARILKSTQQNDTANNAINAIRSMGLFTEGATINHYLTDPDAWFIRTNAPQGLKLFQREAAVFNQDTDFDTDNLKYKYYERYSVGWTDPRALYGSQGA